MAINLNDNLSIFAPKPADNRYGPYSGLEQALLSVPLPFRHLGLTLGVETENGVRNYWFQDGIEDGDLVERAGDLWLKGNPGIYTLEDVGINKEIPEATFDIGSDSLGGGSWINSVLLDEQNPSAGYRETAVASAVDQEGNIYALSCDEATRFSLSVFSSSGSFLEKSTYSLSEFQLEVPGNPTPLNIVRFLPTDIALGSQAEDPYRAISLSLFNTLTDEGNPPVGSAIVELNTGLAKALPVNVLVGGLSFSSSNNLIVSGIRTLDDGVEITQELLVFSADLIDLRDNSNVVWKRAFPLELLSPGSEGVFYPLSQGLYKDSLENLFCVFSLFGFINLGGEDVELQSRQFIFKLSPTGAFTWAKGSSSSSSSSELISFNSVQGATIGPEDSIVATGLSFDSMEVRGYICELDSSGSVTWQTEYIDENPEELMSTPVINIISLDSGYLTSELSLRNPGGEGSNSFDLIFREVDLNGNVGTSLKFEAVFSPNLYSGSGTFLVSSSGVLAPLNDGFAAPFSVLPISTAVNVETPRAGVLRVQGALKDIRGYFGSLYKFTPTSFTTSGAPSPLFPDSIFSTSYSPTDLDFTDITSFLESGVESYFDFFLTNFDNQRLINTDGAVESKLVSAQDLIVNSVPFGKTSLEKNNIIIGSGAGNYEEGEEGFDNVYLGTSSGPRTGSNNVFIGQFAGKGSLFSNYSVAIGYAVEFPEGEEDGLVIGRETSRWIYGSPNYNIAIGTDSVTERLNVGGNIQIDEVTVYGSEIYTVETPSLDPVTLHLEFSKDTVRSIEYTIQVEASLGRHQVTKLMCIHNNNDVFLNQYGNIFTDVELASFNVTLDEYNNISLTATPLVTGVSKYSVRFEAIRNSLVESTPGSFVAAWRNCSSLTQINFMAP